MTILLSDEEIERINMERPNDDLFPYIKDKLSNIDLEKDKLLPSLIDIILQDLTVDYALDKALNNIGTVLEYLHQNDKQSPGAPSFQGKALKATFDRISQYKVSLEYAKFLGLSDSSLDAVMKAEIERIWGDKSSALLKKLLMSNMKKSIQQQQVPNNSNGTSKNKT